MSAFFKQLRNKAARFCAYRERSPHELIQKLIFWGAGENEIQKIVDELIEERFLNEKRFTQAFCLDKFKFNGWGKIKIQSKIASHHIPPHIVETALESIKPIEYQNKIYELVKIKWEKCDGLQENERKAKVLRFLISKGFENEMIWKAIEKMEK